MTVIELLTTTYSKNWLGRMTARATALGVGLDEEVTDKLFFFLANFFKKLRNKLTNWDNSNEDYQSRNFQPRLDRFTRGTRLVQDNRENRQGIREESSSRDETIERKTRVLSKKTMVSRPTVHLLSSEARRSVHVDVLETGLRNEDSGNGIEGESQSNSCDKAETDRQIKKTAEGRLPESNRGNLLRLKNLARRVNREENRKTEERIENILDTAKREIEFTEERIDRGLTRFRKELVGDFDQVFISSRQNDGYLNGRTNRCSTSQRALQDGTIDVRAQHID